MAPGSATGMTPVATTVLPPLFLNRVVDRVDVDAGGEQQAQTDIADVLTALLSATSSVGELEQATEDAAVMAQVSASRQALAVNDFITVNLR